MKKLTLSVVAILTTITLNAQTLNTEEKQTLAFVLFFLSIAVLLLLCHLIISIYRYIKYPSYYDISDIIIPISTTVGAIAVGIIIFLISSFIIAGGIYFIFNLL
jgi:hypothetical protein